MQLDQMDKIVTERTLWEWGILAIVDLLASAIYNCKMSRSIYKIVSPNNGQISLVQVPHARP